MLTAGRRHPKISRLRLGKIPEVDTVVSEYFIVNAGRTISFGEFLKLVNLPSFQNLYVLPVISDANEPMTGINHFYQDEISCRAIEIEFWPADKKYSIKMNHPASIEDWKIARHITEALADHFGSEIDVGAETCNLSEFGRKYDERWDTRMAQLGARVLLNYSLPDGGAHNVPCAMRPFHFGERMRREVVTSTRSEDEVHDELFKRMHATQYVSLEYFVPKLYEIVCTKKTFVALGPNVAMVTPWVNFLNLVDGEKHNIFVPYSAWPLIMGERFSWLDERQALIEPWNKVEWPELLKLARQHAVDLQSDIDGGYFFTIPVARQRYDRLIELAT